MKSERNHRTMVLAGVAVLLACITAAQAGETGNAALLYYQAILLYEKPDETMSDLLSEFSKWEIPATTAMREHVEKNRRVIGYLTQAADMAHCDWGYDYSQGLDLALPNMMGMKRMVFLLLADGRLLAEQGDYRTALDRCLTVHKMALQQTDRALVTYLLGNSSSCRANQAIQEILAIIPKDVAVLTRLQMQLGQLQAAFPSVAEVFAREAQLWTAAMRQDEAPLFVRMMEESGDSAELKRMVSRLQNADGAFFERNRRHWLNAIATMNATLESRLPFAEMCTALDELSQRLCDEADNNPDATLTAFALPATRRVYQLATRHQTQFHAVRTAVDLYLAQAAADRLPDALPAGAPLDLFSGKPFEYEKTENGFVLRCRVKEDREKAEANQYEFKINP